MADYTIKSGDTLWQLAKDYGTTVDALRAANNNVDPTKLRIGSTLTIPGQTNVSSQPAASVSQAGASIGNPVSGSQGGGYQQVTNYTYDAKGNPIPHTGYEKIGTVYDPVTGYIEHASGYKGQAYVGANGRYYTPYGALLREDNYLYPENAKISPNGMYYDTGSGWQLAKYGKEFTMNNANNWEHLVPSDMYGLAPGTLVGRFDGASSNDYVADDYSEPATTRTKEKEKPTTIEEVINAYSDPENDRYRRAKAAGLL